MDSLLCPWESPTLLIFSSNVPDLLHYSHFPAIIAALAVGIYVFFKSRDLLSTLLLILFSLFSFWALLDAIIWASNRTDVVMFWWSIIVLVEPIIYAVALYLFYAFVYKRLPSLGVNVIVAGLLLPLILLTPTSSNLEGIYIEYCDAVEGPLALYYSYFLEALFVVGIVSILLVELFKTKARSEKLKALFFAVGLVAFLVAFTSGNIIGSATEDWVLAQYGLFGMPVFIAFLAYLIVRFQVFNVKVLAAQALVLALWLLIGSMLLVVQSDLSRIISLITLVIAVAFGFLLVRSVKREVEQRELIEAQEKELEVANKQQENLLHFISHEVKGYLTESEVGFASISEGDYEGTPPKLKEMAGRALKGVRRGVRTVMEILDASNLKKGTVNYKKESFDLKEVVQSVVSHLKRYADEKGLTINLAIGEGTYMMTGDEEKIKQHVVRNLIDNAIKYTPKGTIDVKLTDGDPSTKLGTGKLRFSVKDSGVGITDEDKKNLFTEGGHGKDSIKVNVHSTGYGLFIAKQVVDMHGGKIWAESEGQGKGSTFVAEFPIA